MLRDYLAMGSSLHAARAESSCKDVSAFGAHGSFRVKAKPFNPVGDGCEGTVGETEFTGEGTMSGD